MFAVLFIRQCNVVKTLVCRYNLGVRRSRRNAAEQRHCPTLLGCKDFFALLIKIYGMPNHNTITYRLKEYGYEIEFIAH